MSAVRSLPVLTNEDAKTCATCGGKCCKRSPGIVSPEDVGAPNVEVMRARLTEMFVSGRYAIDWWEGDPRDGKSWEDDDYISSVEYVRPSQVGYEHRLRHPSWGGACTFLTPNGCSMTFEERPHNCRALEPDPTLKRCKLPEGIDKQAYAVMWLPYADLLASFNEPDLRTANARSGGK